MHCYSSDILVGSIDGVAFSKTKYKIQSKIPGKDSPWEKVRHDELDPVYVIRSHKDPGLLIPYLDAMQIDLESRE